MDFSFTEEQLLLKNSVQEFLQKECPKSYIAELERRYLREEEAEEYPREIFKKMAQQGWLGTSFPEEYGGSGGDIVDLAILCEELGKCWLSLAGAFMLCVTFGGATINYHGNEEQKRSLLPKLCQGEIRFSGAFTEPGGGTDLLALTTSATKENDTWVINGQKTFITGALEADYLITIVRTNKNPAKRAAAFTIFLVDAKNSGIQTNKLHKLGLRGIDTNEIFYTDVRVPQTAVIGDVDQGFYHLLDTLNNERITVGSMAIGNGEAAFEDALEYSKQRYAFGKPIGQFQTIQNYLAQMKVEIEAARLLV